jgi:pSer/pThr/pTyr-binding forkhead associated (FHA) protein
MDEAYASGVEALLQAIEHMQDVDGATSGARSFRIAVATEGGEWLKTLVLDADSTVIGSDAGCSVRLDDVLVAPRHAEIRRDGGRFVLVELGTADGIFVNGARVNARTELTDGDELRIGKVRLRFESSAVDKPLGELLDGTIPVELRGYVVLGRGAGPARKIHVKDAFVVGKTRECDLVLHGWRTPRIGALIVRGRDAYTLLNVSPNGGGVTVNGRPVTDRVLLAHDDRVDVYGESFRFVHG